MDRRMLAVVAVLAVFLAVGLGWLLSPSVEPVNEAPKAAPVPEIPVAIGPAKAQPRPAGAVPRRPAALGSPLKPVVNGSDPAVRVEGPRIPVPAQTAIQSVEYRCRALGQQADLIDRLVVIASGGAVDDEQKAQMVSRVAQMSVRVFEEGESLWAGDLSCDGISDVNLGHAAEFLARMRDQVDLDENGSAEVNQALALLDEVDWPAGAVEEVE